jgi:hypothetical protein
MDSNGFMPFFDYLLIKLEYTLPVVALSFQLPFTT